MKLLHNVYKWLVLQLRYIHIPHEGQWADEIRRQAVDSSGLCLQVHVRNMNIAVSFKKRKYLVSFPYPKGICTGVVIINPHISISYKEIWL